jgi:DNA-directed RNA polymerase specialized sigma24 family protein
MCTDSQTAATTGSSKWVLDQAAFDRLLEWLHPERERAGRKYEDIRLRLIKIFTCRQCHEAEDLADETINRVARKVPEIAETYTGDPALYFYGVANKVHLEYVRKRPTRTPPLPPPSPTDEIEREHECLDHCMQQLPPASRDLVLQYYQDEKREKIERRKRLASSLGIELNALRIRACRIRELLYHCVQNCLAQQVG